jgi:hypothetical protein
VLHGLGTGTDARVGPVLVLDSLCVAAVVGALGWRLAAGWPTHAGQRVLGGSAASAFSVALAVFVVLGPLRPDWSKRAGTPTALLAKTAPAASTPGTGQGTGTPSPPTTGQVSPPASGTRATLPASPFQASLDGSFTTSQPDASGLITVDLRGQLSGGANAPFDLVLRGTPGGEGVRLTSSRVTVGTATGQVVALDGDRVVSVVSSGGSSMTLTMQLGLDQATGRVQGVAQGTPGGSSAGEREGSGQ